MKIAHFIGSLKLPRDPDAEPIGGVARVAVELGRAQRARGHDVTVITTGPSAFSERWNGVHLVQLRQVPFLPHGRERPRNPAVHAALVATAARSKFDVVHGHEHLYLRYVRARLRIVNISNDPFWSRRRFAAQAAAFWRLAAASSAQVVPSRYLSAQLQRGLDRLGSRENLRRGIHVIPYGADHVAGAGSGGDDARKRLRDEWAVGSDDVIYLYCGAIAPDKGLLHLAHAFAAMYRDLPRAVLVIAGSSRLWGDTRADTRPEYIEYEQQVKQVLEPAARDRRAIFLGGVAARDLPAVYSASDVLVVPTVVAEAFGLVAVEALASGKPVVASNVGALPELVTDRSGMLVPPADPDALCAVMCSLLDDHCRNALAAHAADSVRDLTWDQGARRLDRLYDEALCRASRVTYA